MTNVTVGPRYAVCHYHNLTGRHDAPVLVTDKVRSDWTFKARPNHEFDYVLCTWCSD